MLIPLGYLFRKDDVSQTLRMKNGDLDFNRNTGRAELINGFEKASQDLADILLTVFDNERNYGSELADIEVASQFFDFITVGLVQQKISESVNRLIALQQQDAQSTADERIESITALRVRQPQGTDIVFFLAVKTETNDIVEKAMEVLLRPVELDHLLLDSVDFPKNRDRARRLLGGGNL